MQLAVALVDRVAVGAVQLGGRDLLPLEQAERLLGGQPQRVDRVTAGPRPVSPRGRLGTARGLWRTRVPRSEPRRRRHTVGGTRKRSPSRSGAFANDLVERQRRRAARPRPRRSRARAGARSAARPRGRARTPSRPPRGSRSSCSWKRSTSSSVSSSRASRATCSTSSRVIAIAILQSASHAVLRKKKGPLSGALRKLDSERG